MSCLFTNFMYVHLFLLHVLYKVLGPASTHTRDRARELNPVKLPSAEILCDRYIAQFLINALAALTAAYEWKAAFRDWVCVSFT